MSFVSRSVTVSGSIRLPMGVDDAFPLFSPRGEEAWVPGWAPEILWPVDGAWVEGQVFRTAHAGEAVWFVAKLDAARRAVAYDRVDVGRACVRVSVDCFELNERETEVRVEYRFTALSEPGNQMVEKESDAALQERLNQWKRWIEAATPA